MAAKYVWPADKDLEKLIAEKGQTVTAQILGVPPTTLSSHIRSRGLRRHQELDAGPLERLAKLVK